MMPEHCPCCGASHFDQAYVLWQSLIDEWRLAPEEIVYINRQQGIFCTSCRSTLRSMVLARGVMRAFGFSGIFVDFIQDPIAQQLRILEINEAGTLTPWLEQLPHHVLAKYPQVDMMHMPYAEASFDLVIHSDTLEHIPLPIRALSECRRVLRVGGVCAFTVPMLVGRLTSSREGLPPSYHGYGDVNLGDYLVHMEYGSDTWRHCMLAGFEEVRIHTLDHPSAHAFVSVK